MIKPLVGLSCVPAVREDLHGHRGRHLEGLPHQVLVDQLLCPSAQGAQSLLGNVVQKTTFWPQLTKPREVNHKDLDY